MLSAASTHCSASVSPRAGGRRSGCSTTTRRHSIVGFLGTTGTSLDDAFATTTDYAGRIVVNHARDPARPE